MKKFSLYLFKSEDLLLFVNIDNYELKCRVSIPFYIAGIFTSSSFKSCRALVKLMLLMKPVRESWICMQGIPIRTPVC